MEDIKKKCTTKEHKENEAISFCQICKVYMCNKCDSFHSKLCYNHNCYSLDKNKNEEIFTGFCLEENHINELEFFCKNHNKLCCLACICKIKCKGKGQHGNCDICYINDIIKEKKDKLNENIKNLEELSNNFKESINKLKIILKKMIDDKEELKLKVQKIFTKIRNSINEREDQLLLEIDQKFDDLYCNEEIIKESEKLPNKIDKSLKKGKLINKDWNNNCNLSSIINDCINIENNINDIKKINESMKKLDNYNELEIDFFPEKENEINNYLIKIKDFGEINIGKMFNDSLIIGNIKNKLNI